MSGVRMLHFWKDWWKFIQIYQYYGVNYSSWLQSSLKTWFSLGLNLILTIGSNKLKLMMLFQTVLMYPMVCPKAPALALYFSLCILVSWSKIFKKNFPMSHVTATQMTHSDTFLSIQIRKFRKKYQFLRHALSMYVHGCFKINLSLTIAKLNLW